ncbi:MAG: chaperonin GroEL [Firmicutes bacterium]|jgi:chaperonin GroEL|nr:chaperonin GroEL [Bacillota bacterium]
MSVKLLYGEHARHAVSTGIDKLADVVKSTLGPKGRNVAFDQQYDVPLVSNDGATIAKQINFEDPFENTGAELIKQVALKTNEAAGDGTTTAIVLAQNIINEGLKNLAAGANPVILKRGIEKATAVAVDMLKKYATPVDDKATIKHIATIAGNNDEFIGEILTEAFENVGLDGVVTVEDSQQMDTILKYSKGINFENGYLSQYFITDEKSRKAELDNPYVLLVENTVKNFMDLRNILEQVARRGASLLIIAQDVEGEALSGLTMNVLRGGIKVAAVKAPGYGDTRKRNMKALGLMLNAVVVSEDLGMKLEDCGLEICGRAGRVVISKDETIIQNPSGADSEEVKKMVRQVRKQLAETKEDYEIERLKVTLSILTGGIAVIRVGGVSELEMFERKYRMEDAVNAVYAAAEEGVLPGGAKSFLLAVPAVDELIEKLDGEERTGAMIIRKALEAPVKQIAENAGANGSIVVNKLLSNNDVNYGFNALTMKYEDVFKAGVIDPVKVVKNALINASSVATTFLTTEAALTKSE